MWCNALELHHPRDGGAASALASGDPQPGQQELIDPNIVFPDGPVSVRASSFATVKHWSKPRGSSIPHGHQAKMPRASATTPSGASTSASSSATSTAPPFASLPIHPWLLGLWLGDGTQDEVRITTTDDTTTEVVEKIVDEINQTKPDDKILW